MTHHAVPRADRAVATWIYLGVGMLLIQVVLGGVTRLTGSGLSITEWNVVTGTLPPLNHADWLREFDKYRQTPQYQLLNFDFRLSDFQFIYFWEWIHRLWARLIAVAFVAGFIYLVAKKYLRKELWRPLFILFLLGAMQGIIGWIMVKSGLSGDATYVKPTRLALHFIFAQGLICYAFWFALKLSVPAAERTGNRRTRTWVGWLTGLVLVQLLFGALMAGHKAAQAAPTWPDINGRWIPERLFDSHPWVLNFFENSITIHFVHRNLAYLITILILFFFAFVSSGIKGRVFRMARVAPPILVFIQVLLGIAAVLFSPRIVPNHWGWFEWAAQLHQITGMLLLLSLVTLFFLSGRKTFASEK